MKKSLIIKQHDLTDCGPACLLSIIKYYGGYVPIETLRMNAFTDNEGTSAFNLIKCAQKYGFDGSGIRLDNILQIKKESIPCVAHVRLKNGLNHYVVIYEINNKDLIIMDPSKGKEKVSIKDFNVMFSGVIILLHPCRKIQKLNKPKTIKTMMINTLLNNKLKVVLLILSGLLLIVFSIFLSYYLKIGTMIIDKKLSIGVLVSLFAIYLIIYLSKNIFNFYKNKLIIKFNKNVSLNLYNEFSNNIFNLPLNYIKSRTSGEIISRYNELSEINNLLPNIIISMFLDFIMAFITVCFLVLLSFKLTIIVTLFMLVYFIIAYAFKNPTLRKINKNLDINAEFNSIVIETINNLRSIKNLNNDINMEKKLINFSDKAIEDNYKLDNYYNRIDIIKNIIYDMMVFFISSYGLYLVYINKLNIIDLFTYLMIISYFSEPIKDLIDMITKLCFIKTSIIKINEFTISKEVDESKKEFILGDICIKNLSYAYNGIDYIIRNYSCYIKGKSKVLIKGLSGSGKSTLCQIISKQLNNYEGSIYINNDNLNDIKTDSLRKNITYIGQKDSLIVDTIENNIKYERNVEDEEFNTICKICEIDKIVNKKHSKYSSYISESSDNISGGEKQRITLARGLIKSGQILILDESLSEVNKDMEERIIKKIINYFSDKTIIYVSHKDYNGIFDKTICI